MRLHHVIVAVVLVLTVGCDAGRTPNRLLVTGARVLGTRGAHLGGFSGLASASAAAEYVSDATPFGASYQGSLAIGGNAEDVVGEARVMASFGAQLDPTLGLLQSRLHTIHMRVGVDGMFETSAYEGLRYIELPTLSAGYTFHGQNTETYADSMHLHIGPRVALALAGEVTDGDRTAPLGMMPEAGAELVFTGEALWISATYRAFLNRVDVLEARACFAQVFAACVETRFVTLPWATRAGVGSTLYVGLTLGIGISSGIEG